MTRLEEINTIIEKAKSEITNEEIKNKLDNLKPKRNLFARLTKQDISQEEYQKILRNITQEMYPEINKKYSFSIMQSEALNYKLSIALKTYYNIQYSVQFTNDKAKFYPISLDEKMANELYQIELLSIIQEHIITDAEYDKIIERKIASYEEKIASYKKSLKETEIVPYYGTPEFMYEQASYIVECIKKLPFPTGNFDKVIESMKQFTEKYPKVDTRFFNNNYPYFNNNYKNEYDAFEQNFLRIKDYENSLMPQINQIWQEYLTNPNNHNINSFKYIIHTFSSGLVSPNEMKKACCSLASEQLLTTPYGNCGLIFDFNPEAVETICTEDAGSWVISEEQFIERDLPLNCQLTNNNIFYEYPKISKLILPTDLEKNGIARNIVLNHELLNYTTFNGYTEILLNNKAKAIGVFYTDDCKNIEEVKAYAQKYNLPLIHLSLKELREQAGLSPIPSKIEQNKEVNNTLNH